MVRNVQEIEQAVASLPPEDLERFGAWFDDFRAEAWDAQLGRDAAEGKLDALRRAAREEHLAGETQPL